MPSSVVHVCAVVKRRRTSARARDHGFGKIKMDLMPTSYKKEYGSCGLQRSMAGAQDRAIHMVASYSGRKVIKKNVTNKIGVFYTYNLREIAKS